MISAFLKPLSMGIAEFIKLLCALGGFFFFRPVFGATDLVEFHLCRLKDTVRTVRVITSADSRCMTVYTKEGKDQIMGNTSDLKACEDFKKNILKNLKEGGFTCTVHQGPSFTFISGSENE